MGSDNGRNPRGPNRPSMVDAETLARVGHGRRGIENDLHWVRDVVFGDDLAGMRPGQPLMLAPFNWRPSIFERDLNTGC